MRKAEKVGSPELAIERLSATMIIDSHVHVWEIDPLKYPVGITAANWTAMPDEPGTADQLLAEMDAHGVDRTVLVQTSWSTWDNGYIADSVARFPDRFVGHGLIDPLDPDNAERVRYWLTERGLVGFRLHPTYYPDEQVLIAPRNQNMWEELAARDAIVQLHMRSEDAEQVAVIAARHSHLTLIIDHLGYPPVGGDPVTFQPILDLSRFDNIYLKLSDVAGRSQQGFPYVDVHPFIQKLLLVFGSQRIVWGTGWPAQHRVRQNWPSLADELRLIREGLPFLTETDRERILGETAQAVWKLSS